MRKLKLTFDNFVKEYFNKESDELYWTSKKEIQHGVAHPDLSHFKIEDLEDEYQKYLKER